MAWGRFAQATDYDDLPIEEWMDGRNDDVAQRQAYEDAGYGAWADSTRTIPRGMSRGDCYEYHYKVDPEAHGFYFPPDFNGGKGWSGKQLGLTKYNRPQRLWYGMLVPLKDGLATIPFLDAPALSQNLQGPQ